MPDTNTLVWVLGGALTIVSTLSGVIWTMVRSEATKQAEEIERKADMVRLHESEQRFTQELSAVREAGEKLVNKLEVRHDREIEQMAMRLGEQIRNTEANILTQIRLMIQAIQHSNT